jgi:3-oxoacyl-[acyl-carrier protein] reductase
MDLGLKGRVALVAGASRGLGRAIAEALGAEGASLVICARNAEALEVARRAILDAGAPRAEAIVADVSTAAGVRRVVETALERMGCVDILVTNSGGPPTGRSDAHDWAAWDRATALLLHSAVELTRGVLPGMRSRRWGRIINVTSIAAKQPTDGLILSNSVRAAVIGYARTLANEEAAQGITVNNLLPGYTRTARLEDLAGALARAEGVVPSAITARWESQIPAGRLGEPSELAALAVFLASERASYITAQSIAVDGGWIRSLL